MAQDGRACQLTIGSDGVVGHVVAERYAAIASFSNEQRSADWCQNPRTDS
jgi:hypothetical protein